MWTLHICCNTCVTSLRQWLRRKRRGMRFVAPMAWREQTDHSTNCCICMVPQLNAELSFSFSPSSKWRRKKSSAGLQSDTHFDEDSSRSHLTTQEKLHDLVRDLQLPKSKVKLVGSRLQPWHFQAVDVYISKSRDRHWHFSDFIAL